MKYSLQALKVMLEAGAAIVAAYVYASGIDGRRSPNIIEASSLK